MDSSSNAYVIGETASTDFPGTSGSFITSGASIQSTFGGTFDAFVTKLPNTTTGSDVTVSLGSGVTLTCSSVGTLGNSTVSTSSTGDPPPSGFNVVSGTYYEIATTATCITPITVSITYGPPGIEGAKLFHFEGGVFVDVTTSNDVTNGIVTGEVTTLSPFIVGAPSATPTAIRLSSFTATADEGQVLIEWTTGVEIDNEGFNLLRGSSAHGPFARINPAMIPARAISPGGADYEFVDSTVENGKTYFYQLEDIDTRGVSTLHGPIEITVVEGEESSFDLSSESQSGFGCGFIRPTGNMRPPGNGEMAGTLLMLFSPLLLILIRRLARKVQMVQQPFGHY